MEKALLQGERQDEMQQLETDQEVMNDLRLRQFTLIEAAAVEREKVRTLTQIAFDGVLKVSDMTISIYSLCLDLLFMPNLRREIW